jgi:hypothetical protein
MARAAILNQPVADPMHGVDCDGSRELQFRKVRGARASIKVGDTIRGLWKANEQGLGAYKVLTIQIQNGERVIVWPAHQAEARFLVNTDRRNTLAPFERDSFVNLRLARYF